MEPGGAPPVRAAAQLAARLPPRRLEELTARLSCAYRAGSAPPLGPDEVAAYCGYRFPATYAAVCSALAALRAASPASAPEQVLDLGGGSGAAAFAAAAVFGPLRSATVVDASEDMLRAGSEIASLVPGVLPRDTTWTRSSLDPPPADLPPADLVVVSYLLGELTPAGAERLVAVVTKRPAAVLVVEPGTPAGHRRVLAARSILLRAGWAVAAPCPHDEACPMSEPDWCHFAVRVPRSHLHRQAKAAALGYEDEKYAYVAAVREPCRRPPARIVRHPQWRRSAVGLELCAASGAIESRTVPRSAGDEFRHARRSRWGDPWPPSPLTPDPPPHSAPRESESPPAPEPPAGRAG